MSWVNCCISEKFSSLLSCSVSFIYFLLCSLTVTYGCVFSICFDGMLNWNCSDSDFVHCITMFVFFSMLLLSVFILSLNALKPQFSSFWIIMSAGNQSKSVWVFSFISCPKCSKKKFWHCVCCSFELSANVKLILGFFPLKGLGFWPVHSWDV